MLFPLTPSKALACAVAVACCASAGAQPAGTRTAEVTLSHKVAKQVAANHHDTCRALARLGIDYPVLVQQALDGQPGAIRLLLSLPSIARFDGAVATSYAATRYRVAMLVGDEKLFAACEPLDEGADYAALRRSFLGFPNPGADIEEAENEVRKSLPRFWQLLSERIEGADPHHSPRAESRQGTIAPD